MSTRCIFCEIIAGSLPAAIVWTDPPAAPKASALGTVAFLDTRPVFPGHVLVVPRAHHETLVDLPTAEIEPLFLAVRRLTGAVERALDAGGSFVAINNRISQSVAHLHVHIVPRKAKDGLKGFFWPRHRYGSDAEMEQTAAKIRLALDASM